jgi:3-hydroxyisobutyrate dehydrogenase-like beta-hydroxyacid dehydrogenase
MSPDAMPAVVGFIGLGDMGAPMAGNMLKGGLRVIGYDRAGTAARAPEGLEVGAGAGEVAQAAEAVFVSVPDGDASLSVVGDLAAAADRRVRTIVDLSTIGVAAAEACAARAEDAGLVYVDAPVSGGRTGALAGSITVMASGPETVIEGLRPVFLTFARRLFQVGSRPGQGQAMKLLNNFLSASAMAATTEAVHFGLAHGLDMARMLEVLNVSTGQNTATSDKFPNRILTGSYDAGFRMSLMAKDVALFLARAREVGSPTFVTERIDACWREADAALPGVDFTRIFPFVGERNEAATAARRTG